jgi:hypothetical protein
MAKTADVLYDPTPATERPALKATAKEVIGRQLRSLLKNPAVSEKIEQLPS